MRSPEFMPPRQENRWERVTDEQVNTVRGTISDLHELGRLPGGLYSTTLRTTEEIMNYARLLMMDTELWDRLPETAHTKSGLVTRDLLQAKLYDILEQTK